MAELGAIASIVQLADVALRVSGEIRAFLDAYKTTGQDVKSLRDALRDVEANVRNLVQYTAEFKKSKNTTEEFEVLSETITHALTGYGADVLGAKHLLPSKPADKVKEKVHWVLNKRKAQEIAERLNQRNTRLITALEITGRLTESLFPLFRKTLT
ncbi:hypothetical protein BDW02DRAFT_497251 [Decorospora gaudefroyi]|uniref:NACHT-NTPase and P-loop NTPases N-terminal domain-containing protein n=1 Tax=Decorospora gaudefroyi TaxID=184978 RepID=A0A6A5KH33_9PLEO|nr:hypothetical protein BDW02DRAFT_497251 [Decorospora gaudefroyi]